MTELSDAFKVDVVSAQPPRVRLIGELDLAAAAVCEEVIEPLCEHRATLDLDLGEVTFMDSTGLRSLLRIHRICDAAGGQLRLHEVPPQVAHVLTVTGLDQLLRIEADGAVP